MRAAALLAAVAAVACGTRLTAIRGVVDRDEEIWIRLGLNDAGLWAMDVASIQTRDRYRWVWLRSHHTVPNHPDDLYDATWRYVFVDCRDQRARLEQVKHMDWSGHLVAAPQGSMDGINELKPYPPGSIIGNVVSTLCDPERLLAAQRAIELARAATGSDPEKATLARAALDSRQFVVLDQ